MGRDWQTQAALPINLWHLLPWRNRCHVVLATFGADVPLLQWIEHNLQWALNAKLLILATGGSGVAEPSYQQYPLVPGPQLRAWNSSTAKNAAHKTGILTVPEGQDLSQVMLVNLDTDNLIGQQYLAMLATVAADAKAHFPQTPCPAVGAGHGPLSGRVAVFAKEFAALGGYDQEKDTAPAGTPIELELSFGFYFYNIIMCLHKGERTHR